MAVSSALDSSVRPLDVGSQSAVLDAHPTALLVADCRGDVVYANARANELLGAADDVTGSPIGWLLGPLERLREIARAANREDERPSITIEGDDGAPLELGIQLSEVEGGTHDGPLTLVVFQEIGHFLRLRQERDHLLRVATVGAVLPTILHELKNPLASITSAVELLVEEAPPGHLQDELHAILTEVRRMKLGFEGIGIAGRALRSERNAAIDLALRNAVQVFHGRAERDGIALRCEVGDLPLLKLDDAVVRAIAFNLVNNALHACSGGDTVRVRAGLADGGTRFELEVADTGSGMDAATLRRCTDLFFTTRNSGSGLGLALCKSTVDDAGGEFAITSESGVGTTMTVRIPLREPNPNPRTTP